MSVGDGFAVVAAAQTAERAGWEAAAGTTRRISAAAQPPAGEVDAVRGADCLLVDGASPDALAAVRRVHRVDATLQPVVVADAARRGEIERAMILTPGLPEVWVVEPGEVGPELVNRAAEVTRRRRRYSATRARMEHDLAALEPQASRRVLISDAYLAALLDASPDPIFSVDDADRVLSWNPGAERTLGTSRSQAVGRAAADVLGLAGENPALPRESSRSAVQFRRRGGEAGSGELIVVPVEAAGRRVRAVILHDLTDQRQAQAELESQAAELQEQAAELEMINDELQQRGAELEAAMKSRSRFYSAMSHELRTPINAIIGFNALLLDGIYGELAAAQVEPMERGQRAARHLLELVNDVLDLAKIEAGKMELQPDVTVFPELADELLDTVQSLAAEHGTTVAVEGPAEPHTVVTDPRRVRQILLNLLSNAIKYGKRQPVQLAWAPLPDGGLQVEVVDRGRGIAAENLPRIFEEFEQIDPEPGGGTGLGLPISRRLALLLGGNILAESEPGTGSRFTLVLPPALPSEESEDGTPGTAGGDVGFVPVDGMIA